MMYQGSAAYQLDSQQTWDVPVSRPLSVYEGGARHNRHAERDYAPALRFFIAIVVVAALLGVIRIALTVATVSCLNELSAAESNVASARTAQAELMVDRSVLSSADRIQRIATENYGMVYASDIDTITIDQQGAEAAAAADAETSELDVTSESQM